MMMNKLIFKKKEKKEFYRVNLPANDETLIDRKPVPVCVSSNQFQIQMNQWLEQTP